MWFLYVCICVGVGVDVDVGVNMDMNNKGNERTFLRNSMNPDGPDDQV